MLKHLRLLLSENSDIFFAPVLTISQNFFILKDRWKDIYIIPYIFTNNIVTDVRSAIGNQF